MVHSALLAVVATRPRFPTETWCCFQLCMYQECKLRSHQSIQYRVHALEKGARDHMWLCGCGRLLARASVSVSLVGWTSKGWQLQQHSTRQHLCFVAALATLAQGCPLWLGQAQQVAQAQSVVAPLSCVSHQRFLPVPSMVMRHLSVDT